MKPPLMAMAVFVAALALGSTQNEAHSAQPAAGECTAMSQAYGADKLWWGRFSGGRHAERSFSDGGVETRTAELCFASRPSCETWLYRLRSEYQYVPRWSECLRGYRK